MKNSTLIALLETEELPMELVINWKMRNKGTPINEAQQEVNNQIDNMRIGCILIGIAIMAILSTFLTGATHRWVENMPHAVYSSLNLWFMLLVALGVSGGIWFLVSSTDDPSDFGTQLEKLREVLGLTYGEMRAWKLGDLKERAENTLRAQAEHTKTLQGPNGENSPSEEAKKARAKYEEIHTILFAFGLCDEKWNRYWKTKTPEPENKKEEVVNGTA